MNETVVSAGMPLRIGTPEEFARVRAKLRAAGFDEQTVCPALRIGNMSDLGKARAETTDFASVTPELGLFLKLFLLVERVARAEVERLLDQETLDSFLALDLLRLGQFDGQEQYYTPVFFYPVMDVWIASDRQDSPDGSPYEAPPDIVFPAIYAGTLRFLRLILKTPGTDALDLCAGSGIGALVLSPHFKRVVSADLTARSAHFAHFNALLNGRENVSLAQGDLYEPVAGLTFDRIVAHPPYVPSLDNTTIWRDGGATGEFLIRRIIEGAPQHLKPGGTLCVVGLGIDTKEAAYEERARRWLGAEQEEFDIIFGFENEKSPQDVVKGVTGRAGKEDLAGAERMEQAFREVGAVRLIYGALVIRRRAADERSKPWTVRFMAAQETDGSSYDWALAWRRLSASEDFRQRLALMRPRLSPHLQVIVTHTVSEGELVPSEFIMKTERPFAAAIRLDGWVVPLAAQFNGQLTPAQVYEKARGGAALPANFQLEDFLSLVAMLVERGFLVLDELPKV